MFTFTPNPVSPATTGCPDRTTPYWWIYTIKIQNTNAVPFTLSSWRYGPGGLGAGTTLPNAVFQTVFGTTSIGASATVQGSFCTWSTSPNGGQVQFTLVGTNGNGPHTSGFVTLSATEPPALFALTRR